MSDAARVMEAALEDPRAFLVERGMCEYSPGRWWYYGEARDLDAGILTVDAFCTQLRAALAEVRALPASNTETELDCKTCGCKYLALEQQNRAYWTDEAKHHKQRAQAAEARLAQIAELLVKAGDSCARAQWCGKNIDEALRLARGEEATDG